MNWAGYIIIAIHLISLGMMIVLDGQIKKEKKHSFFTSLISSIIMLLLMFFAGTFK